MQTQDYYKILDIDKNATPPEIKKAYKNLAVKYHPDRNPDDTQASEKMAALNEAYAVLSNPDKKREYDMLRERFGEDAAGRFRQNNSYDDILRNSDLEKIFQEIAEGFGIRGLNELFSNVNINAKSGTFGNEGVHGGFFFFGTFGQNLQGGRSGYNDEFAKLQPHQKVVREIGGKIAKKLVNKLLNESMKKLNISNDSDTINTKSRMDAKSRPETVNKMDIYDTITLSPLHAKKGGPYAYYDKQNDKKLVIKIPENIPNGHKIRLKGAGMKNSITGENGDLFLIINVKNDMLSKIKNFFLK
ncbi:MAG: J domain-containing protein [Desulfamplus sp.]|nr:J domain-containing protein [Desulfamplus sp.]